jgi:hypothetical protein
MPEFTESESDGKGIYEIPFQYYNFSNWFNCYIILVISEFHSFSQR